MTDADDGTDYDASRSEQSSRMRVPRSRGVVSGVLLALAGIWAAFVPFVGPAFDFAYRPKSDQTWHWTAARGWYEVLPGGLAVFGGLLLILSANRVLTSFGAWLAALAGAWLIVDQQVSYLLTLGSPGVPAAPGDRRYVAEYLAFFTGIGAVMVFIAAIAIGRLSVRSVRDARAQERPVLSERAAYERDGYDRDGYDRDNYARDRYAEDGYDRDREGRAAADREVTDRNAETWAGRPVGGYGTPGATEVLPADGPVAGHGLTASAVTTELPAAGNRADRWYDGRAVGPDDDTAALPLSRTGARPVAEDTAGPVPAEPMHDEPVHDEPGHDEPVREPAAAPEHEQHEQPEHDAPSGNEKAMWNPDEQSPTTTGELPVPGSSADPEGSGAPTLPDAPPADDTPRRGIQSPRRYFGADPAHPDESADAPTAHRDPVRTDEVDDLDVDDLDDLDEPRR